MSESFASSDENPADSGDRSSATSPWAWAQDELDALSDAALKRTRRRRESPPTQGLVQLDGRRFLHLGSNDYLGLAADSRLVDAVRRFAGYHGWGSAASPLVAGHGTLHEKLELELAAFEGTDAALLFSSGFTANLGALSALVGPDDEVFSDQLNHASLIDGIRLTRARRTVFPHADYDALEVALRASTTTGRRWIVTDTVFSMDGDTADLDRIAALAERFDAFMLLDEAHATGVLGASGRGLHEQCATRSDRWVIVGTLSKALGASGGFVAGNSRAIELVLNRARAYMFSTAVPEATCAAALAALDVVRQEPRRRTELADLAQWLRGELRQLGWQRLGSTQIIPLRVGDPSLAVELSRDLAEHGFYVPAIRPPAVPEGESLLRISLSAAHTREQLKPLLDFLATRAPRS